MHPQLNIQSIFLYYIDMKLMENSGPMSKNTFAYRFLKSISEDRNNCFPNYICEENPVFLSCWLLSRVGVLWGFTD